ncbi:MAG: septum site-determining protein MinC [Leptolyngbya sp. SIO4C1]|nr:septum site-determining protein MinC [Leptolyngbya sp. SIO4C1]
MAAINNLDSPSEVSASQEADLAADLDAEALSSEALDSDAEAAASAESEPLLDPEVASLDPVLDIKRRDGSPNLQVRFKSERGRLMLILPPDPDNSRNPVIWEDLRQQLRHRLSSSERFFQPNTGIHLVARDRLLDSRQIQEIVDVLHEAQLKIKRIYTSRRQTAVAAATAGYSVEQQTTLAHLQDSTDEGQALEEPLYLQATLRSGVEVRHPGTIVLVGDANPGSSIVAEGDIVVWGRLRGVAHAGASGNEKSRIMAIQMQPTQLRIADKVARAPGKPEQYRPEVAYVEGESICIAIADEFAQAYLNEPTT